MPEFFRRHSRLAGGLLVLAVGAAYGNSLQGPFVWDDLPGIANNASLRSLTAALFPPADSPQGGRPLLNLSFAFNRAANGSHVLGYHLVNLLIHAGAALLLFGIMRRTLDRREVRGAAALAWVIALLWALHPAQTEAVTYLSQRSESLMGLFYLLTLYAFIRGTSARPSAAWLALSAAACLLGAACKEAIATAPLLILLYDRAFVAGSIRTALQARWRYYAGLALSWGLLAVLAAGLPQRGGGFGLGISAGRYALNSCRSMLLYLRLAIWPHPLVFDYGVSLLSGKGAALGFGLAFALVLAVALWAAWRRPAAGFGALAFFLLLAPTTSIVPLTGQPFAEHRLYLPLAAAMALAGIALLRCLGNRGLWVAAALAVSFGLLTFRRNEAYRSPVALWADTVAKCPDNPRAHSNLGHELADDPARLPEAVSEFQTALRLEPDYTEAKANEAKAERQYGALLAAEPGRLPDAIAHYEQALAIQPDDFETLNNLAVACARSGQYALAAQHFEQALRLRPDDAHIRANLERLRSLIR